MDFNKELNLRTEKIEEVLKKYLPSEEGKQKTVIEAMSYSVLAGGKRLRPMLVSEVCKLFGGDEKKAEPFMAAIELIHTYSLVHDDLPAMDNDLYRRSKKTTHAVYGEAMGILAGDALLNYAFEIISEALSDDLSEKNAKAFKILAGKSGIFGMIGGQVADIEAEGKKVGIETVEFIHRLKCGALIEAAMQMGAVLGGADDEQVKIIGEIGADIGYAFQIQDDILDVTSSDEVIGKPTGSDDKNEKSTYVSIVGLEQAKKDVFTLSENALKKLYSLPYKNEFLEELIKKLINREK